MRDRSCVGRQDSMDLISSHAVGADEPIHDPVRALASMAQFLTLPARREVLALVLDDRGHGSMIVHGVERDPDDVFDLAATVAGSLESNDRSVVLLTHRPCGRCEPHDARRWLVLDDLFHGCDLHLLDWFVLAATLDRPGLRAGSASRWP